MTLLAPLLVSSRRSHAPLAFALVAALGLGLAGCGDAPAGDPDAGASPDAPVDAAEPFEAQFVWPVPAWVAANDFYNDGAVHSGSADFAVPYWTPVGAARAGVVTSARFTSIGGFLVYLDHGDGYQTLYSHLSEQPSVAVGDQVTVGQTLGYSGRTGNAFRNGAHLHFAIFRNGQRVVIPGIELGDWVDRGDPIPGSYGALATFTEPGPSAFEVDVIASSPLFSSPAQDASRIGEVAPGERLTVIDSAVGYYRVSTASGAGWLVHTVTRPLRSELRSLSVTADPANIRSGPGAGYGLLGSAANGALVTSLGRDGEWHRLLFGLPTVYGWTHETNVAPTATFETRIRTVSANVRSQPSIEAPSVGSLALVQSIQVLETREGWYRITYDSQPAWVAGWLTQGPL